MSEKDHETAKYWNEVHAVSRNTSKLTKISWIIENLTPAVSSRINGPDFYLNHNYLCSMFLDIKQNIQYVSLFNKSDISIKIQRSLKLLNSEDIVLHEEGDGQVYTLNKGSSISVASYSISRNKLTSLKDNKLVIYAFLKVEEHITTKINFFKPEIDSQVNLIDDWKNMYKNPISSDFTFQVGDKIIQAHKTVLIARSVYFRRMFETEMKEHTKNKVLITDMLYATVQKFLEFLYTGSFPKIEDSDIQEIFDLYIAADKYAIMELRVLCAEKLLQAATTDNICKILQLSHRHGDEDLKYRAMDFVVFQFGLIEKSEEWKTLISTEGELASEILSFCFNHVKYS